MQPKTLGEILYEVRTERNNQDARFGKQTHPNGTGGWEHARSAYYAKNRCERNDSDGSLTWLNILEEEVCEVFAESDPKRLRAELVQVAAVCVAWIQSIDSAEKSDDN